MDLSTLLGALKRQAAPQQAQGLLGDGMAQQASQSLQSRPYMLHVQEAQAMGQTPMTPEQFMQMQGIKKNSFF